VQQPLQPASFAGAERRAARPLVQGWIAIRRILVEFSRQDRTPRGRNTECSKPMGPISPICPIRHFGVFMREFVGRAASPEYRNGVCLIIVKPERL
jgi:hypothetical protein